MFNFSDLIQQYGLPTVLTVFCVYTLVISIRNRAATNDKLKLQDKELETQRQNLEAQKVEHDAALERQRLDMEAESERRHVRTQNEIKRLYESRLDDYRAKITVLEQQRIADKTAVDDLRARLERMVAELNEQKLLLQAEKRAYIELENVNAALLRNNEQLVKREQELMATNNQLKTENLALLARLDQFEAQLQSSNQRISDMEQNNSHKDAQIVSLLDQVEKLRKVTTTNEVQKVEIAVDVHSNPSTTNGASSDLPMPPPAALPTS